MLLQWFKIMYQQIIQKTIVEDFCSAKCNFNQVLPFKNFVEFVEFDEFIWDMCGIKWSIGRL